MSDLIDDGSASRARNFRTLLVQIVEQGVEYGLATQNLRAVQGGLKPDLLEEVAYWIDEYWRYALFAAIGLIRSAATTMDVPLEALLADLAALHVVDIG